MDPTCKSFESLKDAGNQIFRETFRDDSLSPVVYQHRMCKALQYYNKADNLARNAQEKSSILKNMAATKFRIGERLYTRKYQHQQPAFANLQSTLQLEKELKFYLEGSLENFVQAAEIGKLFQNADWISKLTESQQECAYLLWNFFLKSLKQEKLSVLFGRLHKLCWNLNGLTRSSFFLKLGRLTFEKAIEHQDNGRFIESLQLLRDNYLNIEEAKKDKDQCEEAIELEESNFIHLSIGESTLARQKGDDLWRGIMMDEESIQMELVWDAVDYYVQSIVLSRDKSLESEAMAHSHLGRLYELLRFNDKSHDHYKLTVDLVVAMQPKNFNDHPWYKQALAGLHQFQQQQQWKEKEEKERVRAPIVEELKDVLYEMKRASARSAESLIDFIYANHPPKNGQQKSTDGNLKTQLKMALLHYHPDKQNMETHGLKWMVLAEEITLLLNYHYSGFK
ncbi:uncharacterized protein LOC124193538 [Daphnia pulex]|uniref:uncharacterized protein LOC124193538 n=1 Tax=Daphnia pulex TaxID=6669 RepID=UPI001EDFCFE0|nr:uncharacterized protein LOC124193538 [Daphnia pulex]